MSAITCSQALEKLSHWFALLTKHYAINPVDHVGPLAGSLLERRSWDHN
jgi:hypothetical protein